MVPRNLPAWRWQEYAALPAPEAAQAPGIVASRRVLFGYGRCAGRAAAAPDARLDSCHRGADLAGHDASGPLRQLVARCASGCKTEPAAFKNLCAEGRRLGRATVPEALALSCPGWQGSRASARPQQ